MGSAGYLNDIADIILTAAEDALTHARTGHEAPGRTYVAHGEPAHDGCDQLVVWHGPVTVLQIAQGKALHLRPSTTFFVEVARCVPSFDDDGQAPDADDLTESARLLGRDLWCLLTYFWSELKAVLTACTAIDFGPASYLNPAGGMAGWRVPVTVTLNDAGPAIP